MTSLITALRSGRVDTSDGPLHIVREHETHSAWVFLTSARAFKIRKPLELGFLDYMLRSFDAETDRDGHRERAEHHQRMRRGPSDRCPR